MAGTLFGTLIVNVTHGTQFTCKALWPHDQSPGSNDQGVVTGPPHRGVAVTLMDACDSATSSIRAFPRSANTLTIVFVHGAPIFPPESKGQGHKSGNAFVCCRSYTSGYRQVRDCGRRVAA